MISRRRIGEVAVIFVYLGVLIWEIMQVIYQNRMLLINDKMVLTDFWSVQFLSFVEPVQVSTLTFLVFTGFGAFLFTYIKNNASFYLVQQRLGYTGFLTYSVRQIFTITFFLSVIVKFFQLLVIIIAMRRLPDNVILPVDIRSGLHVFNDNTLLSVAIFTLLSAIGWGIYAVFIYAVGLFIKKTSVYLVMGAVIGTGLMVGPALVLPPLSKSMMIVNVSYAIYLPNLLAPGQLPFAIYNGHAPNVYLVFLTSALFYGLIAWGLMQLWVKKRQAAG